MASRITHWNFVRIHKGMELPSRQVQVPHDWSIEDIPETQSPFSATAVSGAPGGYSEGGEGIYSTVLSLDPAFRHRVTFQGVFGECEVSVDGEKAAEHFYGYTPFSVVIPSGREKAEIVLKVANLGEVGRWYTGSGLYRPVELERLGEIALLRDGVTARASLTGSGWILTAIAEAEGECEIQFDVYAPDGSLFASKVTSTMGGRIAEAVIEISDPVLWNPWDSDLSYKGEQPLYSLQARVVGCQGEPLSVSFGLREITLSAVEGMKVNGVKTLLKGGCIHHDNGILGACAYDSAEERKVRLLKEAGFNAIRTSHNPPSSALLDACDREGILVIDEVHDEWELPKRKDSYHRHFPRQAVKDAQAMVRRDRSHPSVWCWSIGNEILDSFTRPDICLLLKQAVLECDPTRPVTAGLCRPWWPAPDWVDWASSSEPGCRHLDIVGMNYMWREVRPDHDRHPDRLMMQTETFPIEAWDSWKSVEQCPWNLGDFVWTAQDYIGESGIGQAYAAEGEPVQGAFPSHLAVCGDLDLIGDRRPQSFHRESLWRHGVLAAAVQVPEGLAKPKIEGHWHPNWGWHQAESHWNWPGFEGEILTVSVITSFRRAAVWLNGRSLSELQAGPETRNLLQFDVPYEPGCLEILGRDGEGHESRICLRTSGMASRISLQPEDPHGSMEMGDLVWLGVTLTDSEGVRCQDSDREVSLTVQGPAELLGYGNASMVDTDSLQDSLHRTYLGRALAVLRLTGKGEVRISAESQGLVSGEATLAVS